MRDERDKCAGATLIERLLSMRDVAEGSGTTTGFVRGQIRDGFLEAVRLGKSVVRIRPVAYAAWIEARSAREAADCRDGTRKGAKLPGRPPKRAASWRGR